MLVPKRVKHRKEMRGNMKGQAKGGTEIAFGEFGLKAVEPGWVTNRQIEAARIAMTRYIKRGGKVWIKIFPSKPVTQKPLEVRMGSGKGNVEKWVAVVKPGKILFDPERMIAMQEMATLLKYALIVVASLPVLIFYPFIQKYFVKGMMIGSLKG